MSASLPTIFTQSLSETHLSPKMLICIGVIYVASASAIGKQAALTSLKDNLREHYPDVHYVANAWLCWCIEGHPSNNTWSVSMTGDAYEPIKS